MLIDNHMILTTKGMLLYNKVQAGAILQFAKIKVGSGRLAEDDNPESFIDLKEYQYDVPITSVANNTTLQKAIIEGIINNSNMTEGKYICEIGVFANDPDEGEILYSYANANEKGDWFAPSTSGAFSWFYQIYAAVGNAENVTAEVSEIIYDHSVINSTTTFTNINGTNQKEINESIDTCLNNFILDRDAERYASKYRSDKDENGIFTKIQYKRKGTGTLLMESILSGGSQSLYDTRTENWYAADGVTVLQSKVYPITYDTDGDWTSEV